MKCQWTCDVARTGALSRISTIRPPQGDEAIAATHRSPVSEEGSVTKDLSRADDATCAVVVIAGVMVAVDALPDPQHILSRPRAGVVSEVCGYGVS